MTVTASTPQILCSEVIFSEHIPRLQPSFTYGSLFLGIAWRLSHGSFSPTKLRSPAQLKTIAEAVKKRQVIFMALSIHFNRYPCTDPDYITFAV